MEEVERIISENKVAVFSKSYCPYCRAAKALLTSLGVQFHVTELDQTENGQELQAALAEKTGRRTVPSVWIGGKFVGGNDDTQSKHRSGELDVLLKEAGAVIQKHEL